MLPSPKNQTLAETPTLNLIPRWSGTHLEIPPHTPPDLVRGLIRDVATIMQQSELVLADCYTYLCETVSKEAAQQTLHTYHPPAVARAVLDIAQVPRGLRHPNLSPDHYRAVSSMAYEMQIHWLKTAVEHSLTPRDLEASIRSGSIVRLRDQRPQGATTYLNAARTFSKWLQTIGGIEEISNWTKENKMLCLETLEKLKNDIEMVINALQKESFFDEE